MIEFLNNNKEREKEIDKKTQTMTERKAYVWEIII